MGPNPTPNHPTPKPLGEGLAVAGPRRTLSNGGLRPFHHKSTLFTRESLNFFRDRQYRQRWVQTLKTALGTDRTDSVGYRQYIVSVGYQQYRQRWLQTVQTALGTDSTDSVRYRQYRQCKVPKVQTALGTERVGYPRVPELLLDLGPKRVSLLPLLPHGVRVYITLTVRPAETQKVRILKPVYPYKSHVTSSVQAF